MAVTSLKINQSFIGHLEQQRERLRHALPENARLLIDRQYQHVFDATDLDVAIPSSEYGEGYRINSSSAGGKDFKRIVSESDATHALFIERRDLEKILSHASDIGVVEWHTKDVAFYLPHIVLVRLTSS